MGAPVVHFEITTAGDPAECQQFYRDLFDWEIDADNPMQYGVVRTNAGKGVDGGISAPEPGGSPAITFYVEVPEIDVTLKAVEAAGGTVVMPRTEITGMITLGVFADPQGNVVGLVEPRIPA